VPLKRVSRFAIHDQSDPRRFSRSQLLQQFNFGCNRYELAMMRDDVQAGILERAAACSFYSKIASHEHRAMFRMLRRLWNTLARESSTMFESDVTEQYEDLCAIHAQLAAAAKCTLH
jgi:hypothetical protein